MFGEDGTAAMCRRRRQCQHVMYPTHQRGRAAPPRFSDASDTSDASDGPPPLRTLLNYSAPRWGEKIIFILF